MRGSTPAMLQRVDRKKVWKRFVLPADPDARMA
jgi:hypothetical protein